MDFAYELEQLQDGNKDVKVIKSIIKKHKTKADKMKGFYERYKTDDLPIYTRETDDPMEINSQLNNDFFSEIVDIRTGYFAGNEVSYVVNKEAEEEWKDFKIRNRLADLDSETTKHAGIAGYSVRLLYIDKDDARERIAIVPAWESVLLGSKGIDEPDFGLRYYTIQITEEKTELRAELHEAGKMTEYRGASVETLAFHEEHKNVFAYCPMWGYMNNDELQGEVEKAITLIDAFDRSISDVNSEIEAFRSAYLAFFGVIPPDEKEEKSMAKSGTFYFEDGQDGKFLVKQLQTEAIESHLDRLHENIYLFTKTPNFRDKKYGSVPSGISLKHMMQPLENKVIAFERKFNSGNIRMFEILASSWAIRKVILKPYEVKQTYTRNFPKDLLYEAQVQTEMKGNFPEEFRLAQFPGVQDPVAMLEQLQKEQMDVVKQFMEEQKKVNGKIEDEPGEE